MEVGASYELSETLNNISRSIRKLGINNADTDMGAIEVLSREVSRVADALNNIAEAIRECNDQTPH